MSSEKRHILLSSMGASGSRPTEYTLDNRVESSGFSAFGLWKLLSEENRPSEAWFLMTPEAKKKAWKEIQAEGKKCGIEVTCIDLPGGSEADDTAQFLELAANRIPEGCHLTLDITQGLRHHAFLFYALTLYLTQFRATTIEGAWYCRLETSDNFKPMIDLKPIIELAHWFHALAVFKETGSLQVMAGLTASLDTAEGMNSFTHFFLTGMPIEASDRGAKLRTLILENKKPLADIPLSQKISETICEELLPLEGPQFEQATNRKGVDLNHLELEREAKYIDCYLDIGQLNLAFGLMREWVVNYILLANNSKPDWLARQEREKVEHLLGGLKAIYDNKSNPVRSSFSEEMIFWANLWSKLCDVRNTLQHHGMRPNIFAPNNKGIRKLIQSWKDRKSWGQPPQFGGGKGKLLICPIGNTPGVLYSALSQVKPDRCLVICSESSRQSIDEAMKHAEWKGEIEYLEMENPFTGISEFKSLQKKAGQWLFQADEVHASLTGGTTLMGVLTGRLVGYSKREYQREVREFVLIDKRTPEKQRNDPWQLGEIHYLIDEKASKSDSDDKPENKTNEGETS